MKVICAFSIVVIVGLSLCASIITGLPLTKWFKTDNSTFYIEAQEMFTWKQSYDECQKKSLSLISLKSYQEETLLTDYIKQTFATVPEFWLKSSDNVDMSNINQLLATIMTEQFLNVKLNSVDSVEVANSNDEDNCALSTNGTGKGCETLHGFICIDKNLSSKSGNAQNIVLNFS